MTELQTELAKFSKEQIEKQTSELNQKIQALQIQKPEDVQEAKVIEKACISLEKQIEEKRVEIVKPLNDFVTEINGLAKTLVAPVSKSKDEIRAKQVEYAQKLEKERLEKEKEILAIVAKVNSAPDVLELEILSDTVKNDDMRIKVAIETRRSYFEEQERLKKQREEQESERIRLEKIAKEQGVEAERLAKELAEQKRKLQEMENEKRRQEEDEKIRQAQELAEIQRKEAEKAQASSKVKGLRKVVQFEVIDAKKVPREYLEPSETLIREGLKNGILEIPGVKIWTEDKIQ